jgi:hypothetical protein
MIIFENDIFEDDDFIIWTKTTTVLTKIIANEHTTLGCG